MNIPSNAMSSSKARSGWLAAAVLGLAGISATPVEAETRCLPSCNTADGRFLVIAARSGLVTLSPEKLDIQLIAPAGTLAFQVGLFDGDSGGSDLLLRAHWDLGPSILYSYTLYADPLGDGSGTIPVNLVPGLSSVSSASLPDNGWMDFLIVTSPLALSPSGNYFYRLRVELLDLQTVSFNSFKVRTTGIAAIRAEDQPFSYMATLGSLEDARIVYPDFPTLSPTTYDGTFRFFFHSWAPQADLSIWDGDSDRGGYDGTASDTDDPDTPNGSFLLAWDVFDALPEGVSIGLGPSTGNPPDDDQPAAAVFRRPPAVHSELRFPDGQVFANENPSGNQEWEQYRISTAPFDPSQMDASTGNIPGGTFEVRMLGVDMSNLNALRLPGPALCVNDAFIPCTLLFPFLVGDRVFRDLDGNGRQFGLGETGFSGITLELLGPSGTVIATTKTGIDGRYSFNLPAGSSTVRVAEVNFAPGGLLAGWISTTGASMTRTVMNDNDLSLDFGFRSMIRGG